MECEFSGEMVEMKAITLWEPWATLVAYGYKRFETRSWPTHYRGPLVIQAAKRIPRSAELRPGPIREALAAIGVAGDFPFGCALAVVDVTAVYRTEAVLVKEMVIGDELAFGDYGPGRYAWRLENLRRLAQPVPLRGRQGLWPLRGEALAAVLEGMGGS